MWKIATIKGKQNFSLRTYYYGCLVGTKVPMRCSYS